MPEVLFKFCHNSMAQFSPSEGYSEWCWIPAVLSCQCWRGKEVPLLSFWFMNCILAWSSEWKKSAEYKRIAAVGFIRVTFDFPWDKEHPAAPSAQGGFSWTGTPRLLFLYSQTLRSWTSLPLFVGQSPGPHETFQSFCKVFFHGRDLRDGKGCQRGSWSWWHQW